MNIGALLAGLLSGVIGSMGLGGGAVLIIYLSLFTETPQLKSQGINLFFFIPIALVAVIIYAFKKEVKWRLTLKISLFGMLGTVIGWFFAGYLGGDIISKLFGLLLIILGVKELFFRKKKD